MPLFVPIIIGAVLGLVAAGLVAALILPRNRADSSAFAFRLHRFLICKTECLPAIFPLVYTALTVGFFFFGFFSLFSWDKMLGATLWHGGTYAPVGMIAVPVLARVLHEICALLFRLENNSLVIRRHLTGEKEEKPLLPPDFVFCTACGTRYDRANLGECPNCKKKQ